MICVDATAQTVFEIVSPIEIAGRYGVTVAYYGSVGIPEISATLVLTDGPDDTLACDSIINQLTDAIVISNRGDCQFGLKALQAQKAGAVAAI